MLLPAPRPQQVYVEVRGAYCVCVCECVRACVILTWLWRTCQIVSSGSSIMNVMPGLGWICPVEDMEE